MVDTKKRYVHKRIKPDGDAQTSYPNDLNSDLLRYYSETDPLVRSYLRVAYSIQAAIANKLLVPGNPVPSTTKISNLFKINPITVSKALQDLNRLGLILGARGKNYIIADNAAEMVITGINRDIKNNSLKYLMYTMQHFKITKTTLIDWMKKDNE